MAGLMMLMVGADALVRDPAREKAREIIGAVDKLGLDKGEKLEIVAALEDKHGPHQARHADSFVHKEIIFDKILRAFQFTRCQHIDSHFLLRNQQVLREHSRVHPHALSSSRSSAASSASSSAASSAASFAESDRNSTSTECDITDSVTDFN
jgi:hypothetical protein